jgi:5'-nucleotidase
MHLLLTNDDGYFAPGLLALKQALAGLGTITVVAPSRNQSATGHRKTLHKPLRLDAGQLADGSPAWVCSGAPADCVALALLGFLEEKVDLVVSGINSNFNLAQDLTYSGTVTAALEALMFDVPAIAISTEARKLDAFGPAGRVAARVARTALIEGMPPGVILNVNVPPNAPDDAPVVVTRQGRRRYVDELVVRNDPRGRPYYWIGGGEPMGDMIAGTDYWAVHTGQASVTPIHLDLTDHGRLDALSTWAF